MFRYDIKKPKKTVLYGKKSVLFFDILWIILFQYPDKQEECDVDEKKEEVNTKYCFCCFCLSPSPHREITDCLYFFNFVIFLTNLVVFDTFVKHRTYDLPPKKF